MEYLNLTMEEKSSMIVFKSSGNKVSFYNTLNSKERIVLRACLLDKSLDDLKLLIGYDDNKQAAGEFVLNILGKANPLIPLYVEVGNFDETALRNIKAGFQLAYMLKNKKWWQRILG